jgi:hypothetical protein
MNHTELQMPVKASEHASWGDALREYQWKRAHLPWGASHHQFVPVKYITDYDVKREQRALNPVRMQYIDDAQEQAYAVQQHEQQRRSLEQVLNDMGIWFHTCTCTCTCSYVHTYIH